MNLRSAILGTLAVVGLAAPASAIDITGHIGFAGGAFFDNRMNPLLNVNPGGCPANPANLTCGAATIDFAPDGGGAGQVVTITGADGYFSAMNGFPPLLGANTADILDITNDPTGAPASYAPPGVPILVPNFLTNFSDPDYPGLHFDLTRVLLSGGAACTGNESGDETCSEGPFVLTHTVDGMKIQFDVLGDFISGNGFDSGHYFGSFSMVVNGLDFPTLWDRIDNTGLDLMCGTNNNVDCTFSGNFDNISGIPEPATLTMFGLGSAALAAIRRRKNAQKK